MVDITFKGIHIFKQLRICQQNQTFQTHIHIFKQSTSALLTYIVFMPANQTGFLTSYIIYCYKALCPVMKINTEFPTRQLKQHW